MKEIYQAAYKYSIYNKELLKNPAYVVVSIAACFFNMNVSTNGLMVIPI